MKGPAMENLTFDCKTRQWYSLNSFVYSNHLQTVISKGVKRARVFVSGRVALRDLVFYGVKNKRSLDPIRSLKKARPH
jgi:hypothetical protein